MPQLDPSSFSSQLFWLTVFFVLLYVMLAKFLLPGVQSVLALRERTLDGDLGSAAKLKEQAEAVKQQYEAALADARKQSQLALSEAQAGINAETAKRQADIDAAMARKAAESETAIQKARQGAMEKLTPVASDIAAQVVEMLIHKRPDESKLRGKVEELAKERMI